MTIVKSSSLLSLDGSNHLISNLVLEHQRYRQHGDVMMPRNQWNQEQANIPSDDSIFGAKIPRRSSFLFEMLVQEEAQKAVSLAHIETNLIIDANREEDTTQVYIENNSREENESYWDMPSDSACEISEEDKKVLSTGQVEKLLVEDALRRIEEAKKQESTEVANSLKNNSYWDWPSEPVLESEKRSNMIASIILHESIRQQLAIDHITAIETACSRPNDNDLSSQMECTSSGQVSTDYWCWNTSTEEEKVDEDNNEVVAPHVYDPTHPNHAYWDFPNKSHNPQTLREKLINNILNEERIRKLLSSEAVEVREVNFHRLRNEIGDHTFNSAHVLESVPSNYWDFVSDDMENLLSLLSKEKQEVINRILKEDGERFVVSTENIENNLRIDSCNADKTTEDVKISPLLSAYWEW